MNTGLWFAQGLLSLAFFAAGAMKVFAYERAQQRLHFAKVAPQPTVLLVGTLELLGAIGVILPAATGILPWLTPLAALGLALLMIGAAGFNLRHHQPSHLLTNVILLVLAGGVAYGRFAGLA